MRPKYSTALLLLLTVFIYSCKKSDSNQSIIPVENITYTNVKVSGTVIDEIGNPVQNAAVKFGTVSITTDISGHFETESLIASNKYPTVRVEKSGYFKNSRSFKQQSGFNYVKIQLMPKGTPAVVNGATGGNITAASGLLKLAFPVDAFVDDAGALYNGIVKVYTSYICPDSAAFRNQMPGWLMGRDSSGKVSVLRSFGMANIEIESASGGHLKINPGKKVGFTLPVLASQQADAAATIPMWFWNDTTGIWIKEGTGTRVGNNYTGEVAHFSTWNFDGIYPPVLLKATFVSANGTPVSHKGIETDIGVGYLHDYTMTNESGKMEVYVVRNWDMTMKLEDDCGQVLYTQHLGVLTTDTDLGTIVVNNVPPTLTIKGKLVDCNSVPISSGKAYVQLYNTRYVAATNATGDFTIETLGCLSVNNLTLTGYNTATNEQSTTQTLPISGTLINAGNISVCNNIVDEFIQIIRNTDTFNFRYPECTTIFGAYSIPTVGLDSSRTNIFASRPVSNFYSGIIMNKVPAAPAVPGTMKIYSVSITNADSIPSYDPIYLAPQPLMTITEYGAVGQYISGSFVGQLHRANYQQTLIYNFKISFRVKRTQ